MQPLVDHTVPNSETGIAMVSISRASVSNECSHAMKTYFIITSNINVTYWNYSKDVSYIRKRSRKKKMKRRRREAKKEKGREGLSFQY